MHPWCRCGCALCLTLFLGCGGHSTAACTVSGVITLDGQTLSGAKVEFTPLESGASSVGFTDAQGSFRLKQSATVEGASPGIYRVTIFKTEERPLPGSPDEMTEVELIPAIYNSASTLQKEVVAGKNQFTFDLTSQGAKTQ